MGTFELNNDDFPLYENDFYNTPKIRSISEKSDFFKPAFSSRGFEKPYNADCERTSIPHLSNVNLGLNRQLASQNRDIVREVI